MPEKVREKRRVGGGGGVRGEVYMYAKHARDGKKFSLTSKAESTDGGFPG